MFKFVSVGKADRSTPTTKSRVKKSPLASVNKGRPADAERTRLKCQRAETGHSGDGRLNSEMCAPRAKRSVLDLVRSSEVAE